MRAPIASILIFSVVVACAPDAPDRATRSGHLPISPGIDRTPPAADEIRIALDPTGDEVGGLRIGCTFLGDTEGTTVVELDAADLSEEKVDRVFDSVGAFDVDGKGLEVTGESPLRWRIDHPPGAIIRFEGQVAARSELPGGEDDPARPVVQPDLAWCFGGTAFPLPRRMRSLPTIVVRFEARYPDPDLPRLFSLEDRPAAGALRVSPEAWRQALYIAGRDLRVLERGGAPRPLRVAFLGSGLGLVDADFADRAALLVARAREYFEDPSGGPDLLGVLPLRPTLAMRDARRGLALDRSVSLFVTPVQADGERAMPIEFLMAHEIVHAWIGRLVRHEVAPGEGAWFAEGFADFVARRLLLRAGIWSLDAYVEDLNRQLEGFFVAPRERPSGSEPGEALEHRRGQIMALLADAEMRRRSEGAESLDDHLRRLVAAAREGRSPLILGTAPLVDGLAKRTSPEFGESLLEILRDGALPLIPSDAFAPALRLHWESIAIGEGRKVSVPRFVVASRAAEDAAAL